MIFRGPRSTGGRAFGIRSLTNAVAGVYQVGKSVMIRRCRCQSRPAQAICRRSFP